MGRRGNSTSEAQKEGAILFKITGERAFLAADQFYTTTFTTLNGSGVTGEAIVAYDIQTQSITVAVSAAGLEPNMVHVQHIHGFTDGTTDATTPTLAQDDDGDGYVELAEGLDTYGPVLLNLKANHDNSSGGDNGHEHGGDLSLFPTAPNGIIYFVESYQLPAEMLPADPLLDLREIVLHGLTVPAGAGAGTTGEIDGTAGYKLVLPVASGELSPVTTAAALSAFIDATDFDTDAATYRSNGGNNGRPPTSPANPRSNDRDNNFSFDISRGRGVERDLGDGQDRVTIRHDDSVSQIRITFTSSEVGNGSANDSGTLANQDGGLAVRVQAENGMGGLVGAVSRFDDEGVIFTTKGNATFDVRDLVSGAARGDQFDVVILGTSGGDTFNVSGSSEAYYINGGMGDDTLTGGTAADFLVGGAGNDTLNGGDGNDSFIGGGGNDTIVGGSGNDRAIFNVSTDGGDSVNLGSGDDVVAITAPAGGQIRLTFTSAEVGNGNANDSGALANQDGGLAVRLQLEGAGDTLVGATSRVDDEGITFTTVGDATFDVRDLVSGTARGDQFDVVQLGTEGANIFDASGQADAYYINGGMGDDTITGGLDADFLVGGAGNDRLNGGASSDRFIGGAGADVFIFTGAPGDDTINDFVSGTDKIDLTAYGITSANVSTSASGANTIVAVDMDLNGSTDFTITLLNVGAPAAGDYLF